ncbi:recombinase family protein [Sinorhizobium meliloti]|uniref:recombinase family protein n=1 Tax=Rhizobium meliloti TaxID=382 RepID=UPI0030CBC52B
MALIGYARVSTRDHTVAAQLDELQKVECARIFEETASKANRDRPQLAAALDYMREGDTLVVWKLDRLARSLKQLIETVEALEDRGIGFRSLTEAIDTTKAGGGLVVQIFGALAEFERGVIREPTRAGLNAARSRGRKGGRPPKLKASDLEAAKVLLADREINVEDVARRLGVSPATLYRYIPAARSSVGLVGWAGSEKTSERAPT